MLSVVAFILFAASVLRFWHIGDKGENFIEKFDSLGLRLGRRWENVPSLASSSSPFAYDKVFAQMQLFIRAHKSTAGIVFYYDFIQSSASSSSHLAKMIFDYFIECFVPFSLFAGIIPTIVGDILFSSCCCDTCALCVFWICARNPNTNELYEKSAVNANKTECQNETK